VIAVIIAGEIIVLYGIASNMVPYLINTLQITDTERATNIVNIFMGITFLLSIAWGFLADTLLGRYFTIVVCSFFTAIVSSRGNPNTEALNFFLGLFVCANHVFDSQVFRLL
jgi:dipeptide/tripeptide permease